MAVGTITTHFGDILSRGEPDAVSWARAFADDPLGGMTVEEKSFVHVGMEACRGNDFSAVSTQAGRAKKIEPSSTSHRAMVIPSTTVVPR